MQVRAQVLALEMLTNTASFLVAEDQGEGDDCDWDSMEAMTDEMLQSSTALTNSSQLTAPSALMELAPFIELILPKLATPAASVLALSKSRSEVLSMCNALWGLAGKAASLLGNLAVGMDAQGGPYFLCWGKLRAMLVVEAPEGFLGQVVAAMASVLRQAHAHNVAQELGGDLNTHPRYVFVIPQYTLRCTFDHSPSLVLILALTLALPHIMWHRLMQF